MAQRIAIYDMDKTITRKPTWTRFLRAASHRRWRGLLWPLAGVAGVAYMLRLTDRAKLKQATQRWMIGPALAEDHGRALADAFADTEAANGVLAGARNRIAADRASGYRLVMATASFDFYARAIADRLGFDDVIATASVRSDAGALLARIDGENCYGPVKLAMIQAWMDREEIGRNDAHIRFYSDHVSDAPTLEWSDEPFAVNAHEPLRKMAQERGWPLLDWRE